MLAYRLIATLVVMIALLMAFRRYRAYHAIAALLRAQRSKRLFALELAASFSVYGLLRRYVPLDAAQATTFETEAVVPLGLCFGSRSSRGLDCPRR